MVRIDLHTSRQDRRVLGDIVTSEDYVAQLSWIIPLMLATSISGLVSVPTIRHSIPFRYFQVPAVTFGLSCIIVNACVAFLFGGILFGSHPFVASAIFTFLALTGIEYAFVDMWIQKMRPHGGVKVAMSPADYKTLVLDAEERAQELLFLPKRMSVMFKPQEMIEAIAASRHDPGSESYRSYIEEHVLRRGSFQAALARGAHVRMIYNKLDLISYFQNREHIDVATGLSVGFFREMLVEWKRLQRVYPQTFFVGLTDAAIALRYELIDGVKIVVHESAGSKSKSRLNALFIEDVEVGRKVREDFETIWDQIDHCDKTAGSVSAWIDAKLLPILDSAERGLTGE